MRALVRAGDEGRRGRRRLVADLRARQFRRNARADRHHRARRQNAAACTSATCATRGPKLLEAIDELIEDLAQVGRTRRNLPFQAGRARSIGARSTLPSPGSRPRARPGLRITADMYTYPASSTGFDAAFPLWVQAGGLEKWIERLKDPEARAKALAEMRGPRRDWEHQARRGGAGQGPPRRLQDRQAEAADRKDPRRGRPRARQVAGRDRGRPDRRGRQPRPGRLFRDERGQCPPRRSDCRG